MKLSELESGKEAYIKEVLGDGEIKKRINEMGFIAGRKVKAIKLAPLKDPIEYDILGYKISIRKKEADLIIIEQLDKDNIQSNLYKYNFDCYKNCEHPDKNKECPKLLKNRTINVALIGNPNSGKTTIFNYATNSKERVANYSGVTVASKEAEVNLKGYNINVIDLPGTYSLTSYSPEELFVLDYILNKDIDIIINVLDSGNLERNLYLTTQLIDSGKKVIVALNMFDELKAEKGDLDYETLGKMIGIPFIPTISKNGTGLNELFEKVIDVYELHDETVREVNIPYGFEIENALEKLVYELNKTEYNLMVSYRMTAINLLAADKNIVEIFKNNNYIIELSNKLRASIEKLLNHDVNTEIVNFRYGFIEGALSETFKKGEKYNTSQNIDKLLTNKYLGLPMFFIFVWLIFYATFKLGEYPMEWIDHLVNLIGENINVIIPDGIINSLIVDGIIGGVGGIIVFLPNIIILFFLISVMEDTGYMARTAFLMDKVMHKIGLHGKSFIPLLMGFGCNIPAIMATRTIESKRDRVVTMLITPFMSCSARLPVYVLFISAFFPAYKSGVLFLIYGIGILAALITAIILDKTVFKKNETPFVMELPPYRMPTLKAISKYTWFKTSHFINKMGTVILIASIVIWGLGYFPQNKEIIIKYDKKIEQYSNTTKNINTKEIEKLENIKNKELLEQSYISRIGKFIQPVFEPLGFDWKMSISLLTGIMAKEVVVSSMALLYTNTDDNGEVSNQTLALNLRKMQKENNIPLVTYFGFLVFVLLYFPCVGTLVAINKETSNYKYIVFSIVYPLLFAWVLSFLIYQIGTII